MNSRNRLLACRAGRSKRIAYSVEFDQIGFVCFWAFNADPRGRLVGRLVGYFSDEKPGEEIGRYLPSYRDMGFVMIRLWLGAGVYFQII